MTDSLLEEFERHITAIQEYGSDADLEAFGAALFKRRAEILASLRQSGEAIERAAKVADDDLDEVDTVAVEIAWGKHIEKTPHDMARAMIRALDAHRKRRALKEPPK